QPLDIARILADQDGCEIVDRALHHTRPAAAFTESGYSRVGVNFDKEPVARRALTALSFCRIKSMGCRIGIFRRKLRLHQESFDVLYSQDRLEGDARILATLRRPARGIWIGYSDRSGSTPFLF